MSNRTTRHREIVCATVLSVVLLAVCCALGVTPASNPQTQPASGPFKVAASRGAKPLPCGVNAPTHKAYQDAENRWYQNHVVEAYQKLGRRSPAWDDTVVQMLNMTSSLIDVDFTVAQTQVGLANKAIDAGCDDPLVLFHHARAQRIGGAVSSTDFRQAIQALRQSPYPKSLTSWAMVWLYGRLTQDQKEEEAAAELEGQLLDDLCAAIRSGDFEPGQKRVLLHYVESGLQCMKTGKATLYQRVAAMEDGEPWVRQVLAGNLCINLAWEARGGGWAYKVTQEGWEGFRKNMATARKHLLKACELSPDAPEGPSAMIPLAMADPAGPDDTPRYWFDRAVAAQFNYIPAYSSLLWSLRPRWGGSHDAMYKFGLECAATQRYDTNVPRQLFEALRGIADDYQNDWGEVLSNESIYQQVQQMLDGYLRTGQDRKGILSTKLGLAVLGSRWEDAATLLPQLSGPPSEEALAYLATNAHEVMKAIEAHKMP
jgi:hypothetical protein